MAVLDYHQYKVPISPHYWLLHVEEVILNIFLCKKDISIMEHDFFFFFPFSISLKGQNSLTEHSDSWQHLLASARSKGKEISEQVSDFMETKWLPL